MSDEYIKLTDAIDALRRRINANTSPAQKEMLRLAGIEMRKRATSDVKPVVYGVWLEEEGSDTQVCSNCGEEHCWADYRASYCEDCGAKMRRMHDD